MLRTLDQQCHEQRCERCKALPVEGAPVKNNPGKGINCHRDECAPSRAQGLLLGLEPGLGFLRFLAVKLRLQQFQQRATVNRMRECPLQSRTATNNSRRYYLEH